MGKLTPRMQADFVAVVSRNDVLSVHVVFGTIPEIGDAIYYERDEDSWGVHNTAEMFVAKAYQLLVRDEGHTPYEALTDLAAMAAQAVQHQPMHFDATDLVHEVGIENIFKD